MRPDSDRSYLSVCENNGENVETQKLESGRHFGGSCLHGHAKTAPAHWSPRHNVPDIKCSPHRSQRTVPLTAPFDRQSAFIAASLTVSVGAKLPTYLHTNPVYVQAERAH